VAGQPLMQAQAERFGADVRYEDALSLKLEGDIKEITVEGGSPPPTTAMFCSRKKKPSQVAHQETPWPDSRFSSSRPSSR
jgi:hypothetical protein